MNKNENEYSSTEQTEQTDDIKQTDDIRQTDDIKKTDSEKKYALAKSIVFLVIFGSIMGVLIFTHTVVSKHNKEKKADRESMIQTMAGDISLYDYLNFRDIESEYIDNMDIPSEVKDEISRIQQEVSSLDAGSKKDIEEKYGSIDEYIKIKQDELKKQYVHEKVNKTVSITKEDIGKFVDEHPTAGLEKDNAYFIVFNDADKASDVTEYVNGLSVSKEECKALILKKLSDVAGKGYNDFSDIPSTSAQDDEISLVRTSISDRYYYAGRDKAMKDVFDNLENLKATNTVKCNNKATVFIRVSNNEVESDDSLINKQILEVKQQEAYKVYVTDEYNKRGQGENESK